MDNPIVDHIEQDAHLRDPSMGTISATCVLSKQYTASGQALRPLGLNPLQIERLLTIRNFSH
jgi:hypothetical protein